MNSPVGQDPRSVGIESVARYFRGDLKDDALAGLTVAVMGVPQAMAYALIAGLPPVYGLYTAIVTCVVAAILGSSNHLVTGPTNALCMVMASLTQHLPPKYASIELTQLEAILLLTFMTGAIQLMFGALRLGGIIRYVSNSVVIGFTAGAGILIAFNQVQNILGLDLSERETEYFYQVLLATFQHLGETNFYAIGVGAITIAILVILPRIDPRLPAALLGVIVAGAVSYFLGWHDREGGITIVRHIENGVEGTLPPFGIPTRIATPDLELTRELGFGALALAILGLIEAASIARAVATSSGQRLNFTREFVGQGASNSGGSIFSCFAGSGSFTRTAVCFKARGRTRMAAVFSAVWTAAAVLLLAPVANYIPKAALAGLLIVIAYSMIDKRRLELTWKSGKNPRLVLVGTLGSTLILPLEYAIFVGVFLSIVILLRTTGKTDLTQLVQRSDSGMEEVPFNRAAPSPVVTINLEGDLYFAAAEDLDYELLRCLTPETRVVVLRMKRLRAVGSTAMAMLEHFWTILREKNIYLVASGIEGELEDVLTSSGVRTKIGEQNIFFADNKLFQSTELALARAWSIVEMERRMTGSAKTAIESDHRRLVASDLMSERCIRFGNQHQLREAVWLMSGLQEHTKSVSPEPLFLQDREAKLFGELSPWELLQALSDGTDAKTAIQLDDDAVGELLRRHFTRSIKSIARVDLDRLGPDTSLARLLETAVQQDLQVIPICDDEGRLKGLVSADDLLRGLMKTLATENGEDRTDA